MMNKISVLFVCVHNSARSQMAEAFLNQIGGNKFEAKSAGLEPGILNSIVVEVMKEIGIDISKNRTKDVFELFDQGKLYNYVITVCDEASAEKCPVFPKISKQLHWSFTDPSTLQGSYEEKLAQVRKIRDAIRIRIEKFVNSGS